jgi:hypothetical protein
MGSEAEAVGSSRRRGRKTSFKYLRAYFANWSSQNLPNSGAGAGGIEPGVARAGMGSERAFTGKIGGRWNCVRGDQNL